MRARFLVIFLVAAPSTAGGQEPPPDAAEFYERGQAAYEEGRYGEAIDDLERAYALDPQGTILLYNIGLIYEKLGEIDRALEYYDRYLQQDLDPEERGRVEGIVTRLRGARVEVEARATEPNTAPPASPPPPQRSPPPKRYGRADALFWLTGAAAVCAAAGGAVLGTMALRNDRNAEAIVAADADDLAHRRDLARTADDQAVLADATLAGAVVLATTSALLYFLREREDGPEALVSPTRGGGMVVFRMGLR